MRTQLHHLLQPVAEKCESAAALTYRDNTVSYGQLWRTVRARAAGLQSLGLVRDDRVAIYLDKCIETVEATFATSAGAGVFVPVNHVLKAPQVAHILRDCGPRVLITSPERLPLLLPELTTCPSVEQVILVGDSGDAMPGWSTT